MQLSPEAGKAVTTMELQTFTDTPFGMFKTFFFFNISTLNISLVQNSLVRASNNYFLGGAG